MAFEVSISADIIGSDVRAGPEALEPAKPGPQKPEPAQALAWAREGSGPGLGSGPA